MGRHSLLVQSAISTVSRNAAANKQIMADAQTARAAYSKRYISKRKRINYLILNMEILWSFYHL
jgi:hypothetical protein